MVSMQMEEDVQINTDKDQRYKMYENDLFSYEALKRYKYKGSGIIKNIIICRKLWL